MSCRFILSEIDEGEVAFEEGYSIFEPTVALEIDGSNVFHRLGIDGAKHTVVMHPREQWIKETVKVLKDLRVDPKSEGEYNYWLYGTGFGFFLERKEDTLNIYLKVGPGGPTQGVSYPQTIHIGTISTKEWIRAVVSVSNELSNLFLRLNAETHGDRLFQRQEQDLALLKKWLESNAG
ncbi:MAG TPA: hypothetical protein VNW25_05140 [Candidatus Sulfotelmatobacter sp.]|jgi:hypothetical protein|nr:hypothetical protein [Candidatus Sulfotelmatobacter sp.]